MSLGTIDHLTLAPFEVSRLVKPGEVIDLGRLRLRLLSMPGHGGVP
ncbi:hypothetical protein [Pseudomonas nitroreducens]|nr:hypothetical protein [Pseudomonas nitroreducens]